MSKEIQDLAWKSIPRETREEIKRDYQRCNCGSYIEELIDDWFGHYNLTSDEEPSELVFVERKKVQEYYAEIKKYEPTAEPFDRKARYLGQLEALHHLFGDKCLPDKEPSTSSSDLSTQDAKLSTLENNNVEEKELNLCEILASGDLLESEFFSPAFGKVTLSEVIPDEREVVIMDVASGCEYSLNPYGCLMSSPYGFCVLFPSRALYEKYLLDAQKAWREWAEDRKPKFILQVKCNPHKEGKWLLSETEEIEIPVKSLEEAQQASEAVKRTLEDFHKNHTEQ